MTNMWNTIQGVAECCLVNTIQNCGCKTKISKKFEEVCHGKKPAEELIKCTREHKLP
jgi:hypothetical protein